MKISCQLVSRVISSEQFLIFEKMTLTGVETLKGKPVTKVGTWRKI